jgi:hypothetical protein
VCTPSAYFCQSGNVHRCAADGLSSSVYDYCASTEFCTDGDSTCNTDVCPQGQPACNGTLATTCNADGSGYVAGGTECAPQYCVDGACSATLFSETFEDANYDGWNLGTSTYDSRIVTNAFAANGTTYSLLLDNNSTSNTDGLYRTFGAVQPATISWWARPAQTTYSACNVAFYPTGSATNALFTHSFSSSGQITLTHASGSVTQSYSANTWYHLEIRNINWTTRTFDYYVDGVVRGVALSFSGSGTVVGRLDLYVASAYAIGYFDEITFN